MDAQIKKGLLDACVLAVLKREDSYGYRLMQEISRIVEVSESTLYPVLKRLETGGSLTTYSREHNGRLRRYYKLTDTGAARLEAFREEWRNIKKVIDYILEEGLIDESGGIH